MKKAYLLLLAGVPWLSSCNDKVQVQPATGIQVHVYPNPARERATIRLNNQTGKTFLLKAFDTKGNLLLQQKGNQPQPTFMLDLSGKPEGKYQVILETGNQVATANLLKI